jgi:hypothetical protein
VSNSLWRPSSSQAWWYMPVILALRRLKQEDHRFKAHPGLCSNTLS